MKRSLAVALALCLLLITTNLISAQEPEDLRSYLADPSVKDPSYDTSRSSSGESPTQMTHKKKG